MEGRKPARRAIIKKRTGPLFSEDILNELGSKPSTTIPQLPITQSRRIPSVKEKKEKKRERWLLTRKTWKYMADAGRKLIPEGAQNRPEDIPKYERHFHNICANEPRFILWRRKASYPGAMGSTRNSKRRLKLLLSHSHKGINVEYETEESRNADQIIDLLSSYLKLEESRKITTLLGSKTVRPDQTSSPSAQRPGGSSHGISSQSMAMSSRGLGFLPPLVQPPKGINALSEIDQLLERLRTLSRSATCRTILPLESITPDILENKALLKQIYNELKKQQLHRIIGKHSVTSTGPRSSLPHASSLSSLWNFRGDGSMKGSFSGKHHFFPHIGLKLPTAFTSLSSQSPDHIVNKRVPPSTLDLPAPLSSAFQTQNIHPTIPDKKPSKENSLVNSGTQTNFIQLHEIECLAKKYKEMKREEATILTATPCGQPTDDESDKGATVNQGHRRKSSIDNEDVSQSVSDTIKRYLRMARKKSVHDDNANRFKRVNYDRNLRNIRAKGEINPPGMDAGNNKATQTLDAWSVILLHFIRGHENAAALEEAHLDWRRSLDQRIQLMQDYEDRLKKQQHEASAKTKHLSKYPAHSSSSSSAPTSPTNTSQSQLHETPTPTPTGILHSSTQFLSNLWHGTGHLHHGGQDYATGYYPLTGSNTNSTGSIMSVGTTASGNSYNSNSDNSAMQKSKSSSNVGQFVSKKIFKTRSKSQTRTSSPTKAEWTPRGNCTWTSDTGRQVTLANTHLQSLTEVEAKILQRVAIEKINQLNIGVRVAVPSDTENTVKSQKRRPMTKKKAMTTSFFDIGRKEDKGSNTNIFGNTLENCVANDQKRRINLTTAISERGSRNSITSLFRGSSSSKVRSCENLPSGKFNHPPSDSSSINIISGSGNNFDKTRDNGSLVKTTAMQISRSQTDVRRSSQDYEDLQLNNSIITPPPMIDSNEPTGRQVPSFVQECIKHLENHGLHSVGIFRVSTSKKRVRQMREDFDRSSSTTIDPETCPHDVATLLKEFLRDLPEPLLCRNLYKAFIKTQKIRNRRLQLEALSHLVQLLPTVHRDTLFALLRFLAKVASCCDDTPIRDGTENVTGNKMDSNNLATVFAPNILRSSLPGEENSEQESMGDVINVIRTMIDHYDELFRVPAELMDEIYANMIDTFPEQLNYLCDRRNNLEIDDFDSGGSNTPLNSPPPTGVMKTGSDVILRRQSFGTEPSLDGRSHSESSSLPQVPPAPNPRRIYTRDDVMHGNAVSKGDLPQDGSRRRSSKSKNSEKDSPAHQTIQQHQQLVQSNCSSVKSKSGQNSDSLNTPIKPSANIEYHSTHLQQSAVFPANNPAGPMSTRRLSSPYLLDVTGVVTASLKIPVQMQAVATTFVGGVSGNDINARDNDDDEVFYRGTGQFDLSNIPYIEDSSYGSELGNCNEGFPITGSLSFGGGGGIVAGAESSNIRKKSIPSRANSSSVGTVYQAPISYEGHPMPSSLIAGRESPSKLSSFLSSVGAGTSAPSAAAVTLASRSKDKQPVRTNIQTTSTTLQTIRPGSTGPASVTSQNQMEQRLPTSISNIGGAILRSKTADFEKMSTTAQASTTTTRKARTVGSPTPTEISGVTSRGPLYKRQELISSAKRK